MDEVSGAVSDLSVSTLYLSEYGSEYGPDRPELELAASHNMSFIKKFRKRERESRAAESLSRFLTLMAKSKVEMPNDCVRALLEVKREVFRRWRDAG
mgnify:CR=1 FL=1